MFIDTISGLTGRVANATTEIPWVGRVMGAVHGVVGDLSGVDADQVVRALDLAGRVVRAVAENHRLALEGVEKPGALATLSAVGQALVMTKAQYVGADYLPVVNRTVPRLKQLYDRGIVLRAGVRPRTVNLDVINARNSRVSDTCELLSENGIAPKLFEEIVHHRFFKDRTDPVVINLLGIVQNLPENFAELIGVARSAALEVAIHTGFRSIFGTDGCRGDITLAEDPVLVEFLNCLEMASKGYLTPEFFRYLAFAAVQHAKRQGWLKDDDWGVFGKDPRDKFVGTEFADIFAKSILQGMTDAGINVYDIGVTPTPNVPYCMAAWGAKFGAMKTASHNPSSQDGIKFFKAVFEVNMPPGAKFLPEDDLVVSAIFYKLVLEGGYKPPKNPGEVVDKREEANEIFENFSRDPENTDLGEGETLDEFVVVTDTAQGSFSAFAGNLYRDLGAYEVIETNNIPDGKNTNQDSGVANVEGVEVITWQNMQDNPALGRMTSLKELFKLGRNHSDEIKAGKRFAVASINDADGDRGFLAVYDPWKDEIFVLTGDELAYFQTRLQVIKGTGMHVANEESGHIVVQGHAGSDWPYQGPIFAGNGLKSIINGMAAIKALKNRQELGSTPQAILDSIRHPYPPGYKINGYVYYVNKFSLAPGTPLWNSMKDKITEIYKKHFGDDARVVTIRFSAEPALLYVAVLDRESDSKIKDGAELNIEDIRFTRKITEQGSSFVTVESDLAFVEATAKLGRDVSIEAVGDKWLLNRMQRLYQGAARALALRISVPHTTDTRIYVKIVASAHARPSGTENKYGIKPRGLTGETGEAAAAEINAEVKRLYMLYSKDSTTLMFKDEAWVIRYLNRYPDPISREELADKLEKAVRVDPADPRAEVDKKKFNNDLMVAMTKQGFMQQTAQGVVLTEEGRWYLNRLSVNDA